MPQKLNLPFHLIETQQKPINIKKNVRYNAFTIKAYAKNSTKGGIGKPPRGIIRRPLQYNSSFKRDYINGKLPFEIDYSSLSSKIVRLAWKVSIQNLDLSELLPAIIYGLADSNHKYADLAELTLFYILEHAHKRQLYNSLTDLVKPFKFVFRSYNKYAITTGLKALEKIISNLYFAGHIMMNEYERIMCPLNVYLQDPENLCEDIFYGQWHNNYLAESIESALRTIEAGASGSAEQYATYTEIKKAVPQYESGVFPLKGISNKPSNIKNLSSNIGMKQNYYQVSVDRGPNLRLIDVNAM